MSVTLEPLRPASEPVLASPLAAGDSVEPAGLYAAVLVATGFTSEAIAQAEALAEQERLAGPPAPVSPPLNIPFDLSATVPAKGELRADVQPRAFVPVHPALPELELRVLRSRYVPGPNPKAERPVPAATEPPKAEPPKAEPPAEQAPKPKISIRPADPARTARPDIRRPSTMVARSGAQAVPKESPAPEAASAPAGTKAPIIPIRKPEAVADAAPVPAAAPQPAPAPVIPAASISLGVDATASSGAGMKIGIAAAVVVVLAGVGWFAMSGGSEKRTDAPAVAADGIAEPLAPLGGAGWSSNWGSDAPINRGKQISIYRPTMTTPDYRIELNAQIEKKAMGWIFRAKDPRNYYVMKLEWIKPGPTPITALIKYAVINGKETTHTQVLLPFENLSMTTMYKVRTDVKSATFTTWVNEKLLDSWTDDRVKIGGAGVYAEPGELAAIKTTNILALR